MVLDVLRHFVSERLSLPVLTYADRNLPWLPWQELLETVDHAIHSEGILTTLVAECWKGSQTSLEESSEATHKRRKRSSVDC